MDRARFYLKIREKERGKRSEEKEIIVNWGQQFDAAKCRSIACGFIS